MSNTTNTLAGRISALEASQARSLALLEQLVGGGASPAKGRKAKATTTRKPATRKGKGKAAKAKAEGPLFLTAGRRKAFIAAHEWAEDHTSTRRLAELVVVEGMPLVEGWAVGEGYRALFGEAKPAKASKKAAPKAKAKGKKAQRTAAVVTPAAPAKVPAADGPRRANGTIAPKSEWALREALAETGKFDRHEIDRVLEARI